MEKIDNILEDIMIVRTHEDVISYRGSVFNAARKWWATTAQNVKRANYVMVVVDNYVREVYKPKNTWHLETDPGNDIKKFDGERWVFGNQDDSDNGEYCKSMLAPDSIRQKYVGKELPEYYCWTQGQLNPVKKTY